MIGCRAVAVGQQLLNLGDVLVRQGEVVRNDAAQVEDVAGDGVHLFRGQRLGCRPRHRAVDVVPQRRDGRHLHQRGATRVAAVVQARSMTGLDVVLRRAADDGGEDFVALAEGAVTGGALAFPDLHALGDRTRALRKSLEIGPHVDVPRQQLLRSGSTPHARIRCRLGLRRCRPEHGCGDRQAKKVEHSSPHRFPAPARSGRRCCDKPTLFRVRRAIAGSPAARSRCHPSHGSARGPACRPRPSRD